MKKAAIDLGTNSLRAIIAELSADKQLNILEEKIYLCRIGEKIHETRRLQQDAMNRTLDALKEIKQLFQSNDIVNYNFVATSAMRDAINAEEFIDRVHGLGLEIRIIDGIEEAKIIAKAVNYFMPFISSNAVFADQGGGSVEVIHHQENKETYQSLDIGIVRLTEMFLHKNPRQKEEIDALSLYILNLLKTNLSEIAASHPEQFIVIGGTVSTLAKLYLKLDIFESSKVHGTKIPLTFIQSMYHKLRKMTSKEIQDKYEVDPKRADVFLAGVIEILVFMEFLGLQELTVCDRGLRFGLLL
ncbi:MAG: hypothetical protein PHV30_10205 [Candidatus Margulisbacteria bacterium]|nr:hypothetical protein [Candidatus Margulisiibacteriota bacterium]